MSQAELKDFLIAVSVRHDQVQQALAQIKTTEAKSKDNAARAEIFKNRGQIADGNKCTRMVIGHSDDHPHTLVSMNNMAALPSTRRRDDKASRCRRVLDDGVDLPSKGGTPHAENGWEPWNDAQNHALDESFVSYH